MTIKDMCNQAGVKYSSVTASMRLKGYSVQEAIQHALEVQHDKNVRDRIKNTCDNHNINIKSFYKWCRDNEKVASEQILYDYIQLIQHRDAKSKLIKNLETKYNCKWHSVVEYMHRNNLDIEDMEESFILFANNKSTRGTENSLAYLCSEAGINVNTVRGWCNRHNIKDTSDYEMFKAFLNRKKVHIHTEHNICISGKGIVKLGTVCRILGIRLTNLLQFSENNNVTYEKAIIRYRPDCYINIFGELVIPEE